MEKQLLQTLRASLPTFEHALSSFAASPANIQIIRSLRGPHAISVDPPPSGGASCKTLYVLDSSFNPPSRAHGQIATAALRDDRGAHPKRLLLLLATNNADKASSPAPFAHRLALMTLFASDLLQTLPSSPSSAVEIDVGITKLPFFHDKAAAITSSHFYPSDPQPQQVHLIGFDTLTRLLNPKYYPPTHTLAPLAPFLARERLRVTYRPDDAWGGRVEQDAYLADLAEGRREHDGGRREWAERFEFVDPANSGTDAPSGEGPSGVVSSTKIRQAAREGDQRALEGLCSPSVAEWILEEGLYTE